MAPIVSRELHISVFVVEYVVGEIVLAGLHAHCTQIMIRP